MEQAMKRAISILLAVAFVAPLDCAEPRHRVADKKFWLAMGLLGASAVADYETTARAPCMRTHTCREFNPLLGAHPSRARIYGTEIPHHVGLGYLLWYLKRDARDNSREGYAWWGIASAGIGLHTALAIHNAKLHACPANGAGCR
jgi:hypothetical protein